MALAARGTAFFPRSHASRRHHVDHVIPELAVRRAPFRELPTAGPLLRGGKDVWVEESLESRDLVRRQSAEIEALLLRIGLVEQELCSPFDGIDKPFGGLPDRAL